MNAHILVIDDDESMRDLFNRVLTKEGWQVLSYAYADITLAVLKQQHPNLIILDFVSATANGPGWELLQLLKMEDTTASIPVLVMTTVDDLSVEVRNYLVSRYINVFYKPFELNSFLMLIEQTLTLAGQAGDIFASDHTLPILVIDDTDELREALTTVLTLEGYQVANASNGQVALDIVSRADHCLILLDITMPVMNGFEFLRAYGQQLRPHTPVIILSGDADILDHDLPSFVVDVISKPFQLTPLLRLIEKFAQPV